MKYDTCCGTLRYTSVQKVSATYPLLALNASLFRGGVTKASKDGGREIKRSLLSVTANGLCSFRSLSHPPPFVSRCFLHVCVHCLSLSFSLPLPFRPI